MDQDNNDEHTVVKFSIMNNDEPPNGEVLYHGQG